MPDHLHGIIILNRAESLLSGVPEKTSQRDVSTPRLAAGSLGAIVGQFKGACTRRIRASGIGFGWQPRFYDHVIRNEKSLESIRQYISDNPLKWGLEHDPPENLWM
jgi:putative transposase